MERRFFVVVSVVILALLLTGCTVNISPSNASGAAPLSSPASSPSAGNLHWGVQTKTSGCTIHNALPDPACTPGAVFASVTKTDICKSGYSSSVRNVPDSEKNQAYAEYGITHHSTGEYEVDHFISLELGGSNDIANLWPEAASPTPGFHQKDKVENYLHAQVCSGAMSLQEAQTEISTNWLTVYNKIPQ